MTFDRLSLADWGPRATKLGVGVGVAVCIALGAAAVQAADLPARLTQALAQRGLRQARVAALVVRADDGATLFERSPDERLTPASNVKILTAVAALATFGPAHRFTTEVYADREPDAEGRVGTLAVRGGGDPSLTSEQWWRLAADLRRQGLRRVSGDLLLDDSAFDRQRWHPAWGPVSSRAYFAPVGALNANYGAFGVEIRPGARQGAPLLVTLDPPVPYLRLDNRARTGGKKPLAVERRDGDGNDTVSVSGSLRAGDGPVLLYRSVSDPTAYAGAVLRMQLEANGIQVQGSTRAAALPGGFRRILAFEGEPLAEIARLFLKHSNNNIAETLLKDMAVQSGQPGSWENAVPIMRARLQSLGIDPAGFSLVDGSGLAPVDRVAPRAFVSALRLARDSFRFGPELEAALPIAARDGTLEKRAAAAMDAVRAKTGLLAGATSLSGYAHLQDGSEAVFSIIANDYKQGDLEAMAAIDGFVAALVASSPSPPTAAP